MRTKANKTVGINRSNRTIGSIRANWSNSSWVTASSSGIGKDSRGSLRKLQWARPNTNPKSLRKEIGNKKRKTPHSSQSFGSIKRPRLMAKPSLSQAPIRGPFSSQNTCRFGFMGGEKLWVSLRFSLRFFSFLRKTTP